MVSSESTPEFSVSSTMAVSPAATALAILMISGFPPHPHSVLGAAQQRTGENKNIEKRSILTFPPDSLFQINMGITLSQKLERNSGVVVLAFQQNVPLPEESQPLLSPSLVTSARMFSIYDHLRDVIRSYGINGAECLRKMVCQVAETPLAGGLMEDVLAFVLSPSRHRSIRYGYAEFVDGLLESERFGKVGGNCSSAFPECDRTPLDMISAFSFV